MSRPFWGDIFHLATSYALSHKTCHPDGIVPSVQATFLVLRASFFLKKKTRAPMFEVPVFPRGILYLGMGQNFHHQELDRRFESMFLFTRIPFWVHILTHSHLEPNPLFPRRSCREPVVFPPPEGLAVLELELTHAQALRFRRGRTPRNRNEASWRVFFRPPKRSYIYTLTRHSRPPGTPSRSFISFPSKSCELSG